MSRTAHAARDHIVERVGAQLAALVAVNQPGVHRPVTGRLVSALMLDGVVDHYRVSLGSGVMLATPPAWIDRDSRSAVLLAGLDAPGEWGADLAHAFAPPLQGVPA